jgi:hypothetical protein
MAPPAQCRTWAVYLPAACVPAGVGIAKAYHASDQFALIVGLAPLALQAVLIAVWLLVYGAASACMITTRNSTTRGEMKDVIIVLTDAIIAILTLSPQTLRKSDREGADGGPPK